ncbi:MAG TPA: VWA domain-containing protein [Acidobacteriota bacterium]|nr:VWA domain-containing protein [Acidobacteriota bacterium]
MRRPITRLLMTALLLAAALVGGILMGQDRKQIEEEKDKPKGQAALAVKVEQVRVDVSVRDKKDNLITGLQAQHFEVYEDKVKQEITNFQDIDAPMTAVLLIEYSKVLAWEMLYEAWLGSHRFVQQMRPGDWVAVMAYDLRPEILVDFTQDKAEVWNALRRLNYPAFRESNLYDALFDVLDRTQEVEGKVVVVLVSSGLDTFSKKNLGETLKRVKRANATIYTVGLGGNLRARADHRMSSSTRMDFLQADAALKNFAKETGGESFFPRFTSAFPAIFETISLLARNQYSIGYISSNAGSGKDDFHKIEVKVKADVDGDGKPDKFKVNHRQGWLEQDS